MFFFIYEPIKSSQSSQDSINNLLIFLKSAIFLGKA